MPSSFLWTPSRPLFFSILTWVGMLCFLCTAYAEEDEAIGMPKAEFSYELDPYYSDVSYNIPLTNKPMPTITSNSEAVIYRELFKESLVPQYLLLEASVYPMPVLGTYMKSHMANTYAKGQLSRDFNVIESFTAGFQEPWALSAFFGNVTQLKRPNAKRKGASYGYTGYVFSAGMKHIKSNTLIDDQWGELEWKIKGRIDQSDEQVSWSFRAGTKFHQNREINNVYFFNLHRNNTDLRATYLTWLENTNFDFRLHFLRNCSRLVRSELVAGKKLPLNDHRLVPTLSLGFIWTSPDEYAGLLKDSIANKFTLVIRPSIEF